MDTEFLASKFALVFRGDDPIAFLCEGFEAAMGKLREELDIPPEEFDELFAEARDVDRWSSNDMGPFAYQTEYGDGCNIHLIRIFTPAEERKPDGSATVA